MDKFYIDVVGLKLRVDCGRDITGATNTKLLVKKPDGTHIEFTPASIVDTDYLEYVTVTGDLDQAGIYRLQSSLTLAGLTGLGETCEFMVFNAYH
jgi:hypothetical protein